MFRRCYNPPGSSQLSLPSQHVSCSSALEVGEAFTHLQREEELPKVLRAPSLLESILFQKHPPLEEHRTPNPMVSSFVKVFSANQNLGKKAPWLDCELKLLWTNPIMQEAHGEGLEFSPCCFLFSLPMSLQGTFYFLIAGHKTKSTTPHRACV